MNWENLQKYSTWELINMAHQLQKLYKNDIEVCNICNAKSGKCSEDCKFCAQSIHHSTSINTYPLLSSDKILEAAFHAKEIGAHYFGIVTSGRALPTKEIKNIAATIEKIKNKVGIKLCASLGIIDQTSLDMLKEAGIDRYHHNIETSYSYFKKIVSTHTFEERLQTIQRALQSGIEVCSGCIIGMGETEKDRIWIAAKLKELNIKSIPINILIPIKGTALYGKISPLSIKEIIRTIAIFRIINPESTIKIAAGRESILGDFQGLAFMAGANGMLIGGYLTIQGRDIQQDYHLINQLKTLWQEK